MTSHPDRVLETSTTTQKDEAPRPPVTPKGRPWVWPIYRQILKRSRCPILVGPWRGEVGFEALYWLPWLDQVRHTLGIAADRWWPISRGGAAGWYDVPRGLELYAMRTPADVRIENRLQFSQQRQLKQAIVTEFDAKILKDAALTLGFTKYLTLHPAWMFQHLTPFFEGRTGLRWLQTHTRFPVLPTRALPDGLSLPDKFVAVRFYARPTWPPSPETASFATAAIRRLAAEMPVIIVNSGLHTDDHLDFAPKLMENVYHLNELCSMTAENNLLVQGAVLARALGFVGTYGGMAQLALRFGKPSISFYTDWQATAVAHKHLSESLALQMGVAFQVLRLGDLPRLQSVLPTIVTQVSAPVVSNLLTPQVEEAHAIA